MELRVLGPLQVEVDGRSILLGGPKQRLVLALLLLDANRLVPADRLIERIWGDEPPEAARSTLQAYVSRLRKALGPGRIESRSPGYVLAARPEEIDALQFERMIADAHRRLGDDPSVAKDQLDQALALWRGPALADLPDEAAIRADVTRLEELRLAALEDRADADLALGHQAELIPELERLLGDHPLRERLWAALMLALYRAGRQADALGAYQRARRLLRDDLGIDPSPELQRLQERILNQDPDLDLRGRRLRGYELIERVGEGAFGVVYRAYQAGVGRDVAIKVIHRRLANQPEFVRRFEQEARLVARLEHPHIVPLYDYWREPDGAYLAMRYLRSGSLKEAIETNGPMTAEAAVRVVDQVAAALGAAHRQGVIHRDVRPANILFDEEGNAYLSDFGIAKEVATTGALARRSGGLTFYLAPEEIREEAISPATDVYSLGLVLYELLAGEHPFHDAPPSEVLDRQLSAPLPRIHLVRPDLPEAVGAVIERATAKDPDSRFAEATEFAATLRSALQGPSTPLEQTAAAPSDEIRNPYKGLRPFEEADAADFFGREELVTQLADHLAESGPGARLLAVVGPSGSGKSSIVRAGLVPALRRGAVAGSERWFIVEMHPGGRPFDELERALLDVAVRRPPSLLDELERDDEGLSRAADWVLPPDGSELLLIVDQFEELFTLTADETERAAFLDALVAATEDPNSRVRVIITLRADYYDRPLLHRQFGELLGDRTHALTPLGPDEVERAVVGPAEALGVAVEPRLVADIRADILDQPGSLPLLQYALTELFEGRTEATLTVDAYRAVGGVAGALARRADDLYERLDAAGKEAARQLFLRLVTLGEDGSSTTRRRVLRRELASLEVNQAAADRAIGLFGSHRLLSFDRDPLTRGPTVEVAHEALLGEWARYRDWIDAARDDIRTHRRLAVEAAEWDESGRDPSFLLRGMRLDQAEAWAVAADIAAAEVEREYLGASLEQREVERAAEEAQARREAQLQRRLVTRLRVAVAVLVSGVLVAGTLAWVAQRESRIATARELAAAAVVALDEDAERSLALALESAETMRGADGSVLPETEEILHAALQAHRPVMTLPGADARFSADGEHLLLAGPGAAAFEVHDADTGGLLVRHEVGHAGDPIFEGFVAGYSSNGETFVAALREADVDFTAGYDTATGKRIWTLPTCCNSVLVTPDDRSFSVFGGPDRIEHRDLLTGKLVNWYDGSGTMVFEPIGVRGALLGDSGDELGPVAGYVGKVYEPQGCPDEGCVPLRGSGIDLQLADWSPDGMTLATASSTTVTLWDPAIGEPRFSFGPQSDAITALAFGPESGRIATGLSDGTTVIWELSPTGALEVLALAGHDGPVQTISFDPSDARLMTSGADGAVKVWDISPARVHEWLTARCSHALEYSNDGQYLACGLADGTVALIDAATGESVRMFRGHAGPVVDLEFTPDSATLVSASRDGTETASHHVATARIWDVATGQERARILLDDTVIGDISISPDGTAMALGEQPSEMADGGTRLYRVADGGEIGKLGGSVAQLDPYRPNIALAFSPNGDRLASAAFSGVVIWSMNDQELVTVTVQWATRALAWRPDGARVIAVGTADDDSISALDPASGEELGSLPGTIGDVTDVEFNADGTLMATSSTDGTIRLWHGDRLEEIMTLATDAPRVATDAYQARTGGRLAFSPDGSRLAYTTDDGLVRVVALRTDDLVALARARLARIGSH